jgi:GNAT superfamily N-acetyltransferase
MVILQDMTDVMKGQGSFGTGSSRPAHAVRVLGASGSNTGAVLAMASRCSPTTLFNRFHGFTDGVAYFTALLRERAESATHLAWYRSRCIGLATIAPHGKETVELGVLVEDLWQRRGVGSLLVASLLPPAREKGVTTLHADVLSDDMLILGALSRIGPISMSVELDSISVDITLDGGLRRPAS